jgi:glucose dehydrogenase
MTTYESDMCIIRGGTPSAMLAQKMAELRRGLTITVVEAGRSFDLATRFEQRERMLKYGENSWPSDFIEGHAAAGGIFWITAVGGQALHWDSTGNRFFEEDLRLKSMYGLAGDWPLEWPSSRLSIRRISCRAREGPCC